MQIMPNSPPADDSRADGHPVCALRTFRTEVCLIRSVGHIESFALQAEFGQDAVE